VSQILDIPNFEPWLVGFSEAEASFFPVKGGSRGWAFSISQADEEVLIEAIRAFFKITATTTVGDRTNYPDNFYAIATEKLESCLVICKIFSANRFLGHKRSSFNLFRKAVFARLLRASFALKKLKKTGTKKNIKKKMKKLKKTGTKKK
jgi:hypothetical protein